MIGGVQIISLMILAVWLIVFVLRPKWLVVVSAVLIIVQFHWFSRYYLELPPYFSRISLALVGFLGCVLFVRHLAGQKIRLDGVMLRPVMYLGIFFVLLTLLSNTYNREDIVLGLFELRYYFAGFVLTYAFYTYFGQGLNVRTFKRVIVYIALAQLPVSVLQFIVAEGGEYRSLDSVTGTFAVYTELVACQILAMGVVLTDKLVGGMKTIKLNSYVVFLLLLVPLLLSKSKMATGFVIMIIVFSWIYAGLKRKNAGMLIRHFYTIGVLLLVVAILFYSFFWQRFDLKRYLEPEFVYSYVTTEPVVDYGQVRWIKERRLGRLSAITKSISQTWKTPVSALIGYGSGSVSVSRALGRAGRLYDKPGHGPLAGIDRNQYSKTIMEFGLIGVSAFVIFFAVLARRIRVMRLGSEHSVAMSIIIFCLIPLSFYGLTLGTFYMSFVVAFFIATLQAEIDRRLAHAKWIRRTVDGQAHDHGVSTP